MHELPVTENIFKITMKHATENEAVAVKSITIRMGEGCDFVPEIIEEYFQVFAEDTIAKGAKIVPKIVPTKILCKECGKEHPKNLDMIRCPDCGSERLRPLISNDLAVDSIELEF